MKLLILFSAFALAVKAGHLSDQEAWEQFKIQHGKTYRSLLEERQRFVIFQTNLRIIEEHNKRFNRGEESFSAKMNHFGDLSRKEFKDTLRLQVPHLERNYATFDDADVPEEFDWREHGAVTDVRQQGNCGSCWAFSAVGAIEGQVSIHKKILNPLSPQQLVDCATTEYRNDGCIGGLVSSTFDYVKDHGILADKDYPYKGKNGTCLKQGGVKISGYKWIPKHDEVALTNAIATKGPISVSLHAETLQFYETGVIDGKGCNSTIDSLDHSVILVGYKKDYYIAKNSWGPNWGEQGYFRIQRNSNACGIALENLYPVL
ncbi:unnamed protein product [Callosobruchus maculatus]|uniref:Gut cathepsin L-like cysteine protease n=1 Tax=Callosobruchus maculatus TaxID=64391 RepID=A0A653BGZ2_CALMS|nr:unnamed protein product [Callosobruchus maculatus]